MDINMTITTPSWWSSITSNQLTGVILGAFIAYATNSIQEKRRNHEREMEAKKLSYYNFILQFTTIPKFNEVLDDTPYLKAALDVAEFGSMTLGKPFSYNLKIYDYTKYNYNKGEIKSINDLIDLMIKSRGKIDTYEFEKLRILIETSFIHQIRSDLKYIKWGHPQNKTMWQFWK